MTPVSIEDVWEALYQERQLTLLWMLSKDGRLISVSGRRVGAQVQIWIRQDQPDAPPFIQVRRFVTSAECEAFIEQRQRTLMEEGWKTENLVIC
ncbi:MAG: hypothetical protein IT178_08385 [Acidobacteria bacterium]|nr:hypothetical protein [Acidobacteriota bacterium]